MLGAPPALANTRFPVASSDVIGREPPEARATDKTPPPTGRKENVKTILEKPSNTSRVLRLPTAQVGTVQPLIDLCSSHTAILSPNEVSL